MHVSPGRQGGWRSGSPLVSRRPVRRRTSTGSRCREFLQALGILLWVAPDQLGKPCRSGNRYDTFVRDALLDLQGRLVVRIELVRVDQRQVWVLAKRGYGEAKKLLEPKGIGVAALWEEKCAPGTGGLPGASYGGHSAAVASTAAELHRAGTGHRFGFATGIRHRFGDGYAQRAGLVVRVPAAGVAVVLLEIDRGTEDADDLVARLCRYWGWGRGCWHRMRTGSLTAQATPRRACLRSRARSASRSKGLCRTSAGKASRRRAAALEFASSAPCRCHRSPALWLRRPGAAGRRTSSVSVPEPRSGLVRVRWGFPGVRACCSVDRRRDRLLNGVSVGMVTRCSRMKWPVRAVLDRPPQRGSAQWR